MEVAIPKSLVQEHEELHEELGGAVETGGRTGDAARALLEVLHPHFVKEEEFALPPLGVLMSLAEGKVPVEAANVVAMTEKLKAELPRMHEEHKAIVAALKNLISAAEDEKRLMYVEFAERLMLHAQTEEEVLYPAAIVIGEYLKRILRR